MGLFYAWDGIVRHQDGTAQINLLLNRASPWLDIDSHLPYEGKVVREEQGGRVRFSCVFRFGWTAKRCAAVVGQKEIRTPWFGNRLRFTELQTGATC